MALWGKGQSSSTHPKNASFLPALGRLGQARSLRLAILLLTPLPYFLPKRGFRERGGGVGGQVGAEGQPEDLYEELREQMERGD